MSVRVSGNDPSREASLGFYPMLYSSKTAKAKVSKNKKYKSSLPRPFSPVFTNVNFYETQSTYAVFEFLIRFPHFYLLPSFTITSLCEMKVRENE